MFLYSLQVCPCIFMKIIERKSLNLYLFSQMTFREMSRPNSTDSLTEIIYELMLASTLGL